MKMISAEQLVGEEWAEWYSLTPMERWRESAKLWEVFLSLGGSLDPQSAGPNTHPCRAKSCCSRGTQRGILRTWPQ